MATARTYIGRKWGIVVHDKEVRRMLKGMARKASNFAPVYSTHVSALMRQETNWIFNSSGGLFNWVGLGHAHGRPRTKRHQASGLSIMRAKERGEGSGIRPLVDRGTLRDSFYPLKIGRKRFVWGTQDPRAAALDQFPRVLQGLWYQVFPMDVGQLELFRPHTTGGRQTWQRAPKARDKWIPARPFGYVSDKRIDMIVQKMTDHIFSAVASAGGTIR